MEYDADLAQGFESQSSDRISMSDVVKDTMSTTVRLAKEIDELDINQPTAKDTDERVMTSHTKKCESCEVTSVEERHLEREGAEAQPRPPQRPWKQLSEPRLLSDKQRFNVVACSPCAKARG